MGKKKKNKKNKMVNAANKDKKKETKIGEKTAGPDSVFQEEISDREIPIRRARWKSTSTGVVPPPTLLDNLTGLPNRRYLEGALHSYLEELRRYERGFGVLFIDIDNLKDINELLGRKIGDKVLRSVGKVLNKRTRPFDIVGRAGGEEFLATVANIDEDTLHTVAEKLCRAVEEMEILTTSDSLKVTVSIGGTLAMSDDTKEGLIKRAYKYMRESKDKGRNCVTISGGSSESAASSTTTGVDCDSA